MSKFTLAGRAIYDVAIEHGRSRDIVDSFISEAYWEDTGEKLTDSELERLQDENQDAFTMAALDQGGMH